jgi:ssDNA-binding Zn-finger/Zn-ribbon topoisomerase 1
MDSINKSRSIYCPLCGTQLDIRESVKSKPYVVCDPCGMQMFIRKEHGINALKRALESGSFPSNFDTGKLREKVRLLDMQLSQAKHKCEEANNAHVELAKTKRLLCENDQKLARSEKDIQTLEDKVSELEGIIFRTCPECGKQFQIRVDLIKTSWVDGRFQGFRCPQFGCRGIAVWKAKENQ